MSKYSAGCLTGAGSTTLPIFSLYGATTVYPRIREIGVFNTTNTAVALKLVRLTTAGTPGTGLTEAALMAVDPATAICTAFNTHSIAPTLGADLGFRTVLGAAAGSGMVWTFEDFHFTINPTANAGIGLIVENGTGQACQAYISWTE